MLTSRKTLLSYVVSKLEAEKKLEESKISSSRSSRLSWLRARQRLPALKLSLKEQAAAANDALKALERQTKIATEYAKGKTDDYNSKLAELNKVKAEIAKLQAQEKAKTSAEVEPLKKQQEELRSPAEDPPCSS